MEFIMATSKHVAFVPGTLAEKVIRTLGADDLVWYGQYGRPQQAAFYRGGPRRRARAIERRLTAAGIPARVLKNATYMGF
jgi:hypothetical protein